MEPNLEKTTRKASASGRTFLFFTVVALTVIIGLAGYTVYRQHVAGLEDAFAGRVNVTIQGLEDNSGHFIATFDHPLMDELQKRTLKNPFVVSLSIEDHLAERTIGALPANPPPGVRRYYRDILEAGVHVGRIGIDVDSSVHEQALAGVTANVVGTIVIIVLLSSGLLYVFVRLGMERELASALRDEIETRHELGQSTQRFQTLIESSNLGICVHRGFTPLYANDSLLELTGISDIDEFLALDLTSTLLHPDSREQVKDEYDLLMRGDTTATDFEIKLLCADGRTKWVSNRSFIIDWEGEPAVCTNFFDITARRTVEAELRETHNHIQEVLEASPAGFAISHPEDGRIEFANSHLADMNGVPLENFIGSYSRDFYNDPEERTGIIEEFRRGGAVKNRQVLFRRPDDTTFWGLMTLKPTVFLGKKRLFAWIHDVTELKEALEAAEAAAQAKSDFLSAMSHELRTPLNAILGFAQLLGSSKKDPLNDRQKDQIRYIRNGGERLLEMIDDILDLIEIDSKDQPISVEAVDGRVLLDACLSNARSLATKRDIVIEDSTDDSMPAILADPRRFKQAVDNLLSNAVKFNRTGGRVWLDAEQRDDRTLRISVTDTGPGIPEDKRSKLFQPFSQLGKENTWIEGAGVGLALTKKLAEEMGGMVGYEPSPVEGSTFWIDFPIFDEKRAPVGELT